MSAYKSGILLILILGLRLVGEGIAFFNAPMRVGGVIFFLLYLTAIVGIAKHYKFGIIIAVVCAVLDLIGSLSFLHLLSYFQVFGLHLLFDVVIFLLAYWANKEIKRNSILISR